MVGERGLQAARGVVGGQADAQAAPLELDQRCARALDQRRVLGAAGAEDALDAGNQPARGRDLRMRGERLGDVAEVARSQRPSPA